MLYKREGKGTSGGMGDIKTGVVSFSGFLMSLKKDTSFKKSKSNETFKVLAFIILALHRNWKRLRLFC